MPSSIYITDRQVHSRSNHRYSHGQELHRRRPSSFPTGRLQSKRICNEAQLGEVSVGLCQSQYPFSFFVRLTTKLSNLPASSDLETDILRRLLAEHPRDYVIACGGGVVEREENRAMLQEFGRSVGPVIHVTREKEEVIRYLIDEKDRPQWGEDMRTGG